MATNDTESQSQSMKHAGIPEAIFLEDVDKFMKEPANGSAETVLKRLDEQHHKYKFMEMNLMHKKRRLKSQIPDIRSTLDIVKHMQSKQSLALEMVLQATVSPKEPFQEPPTKDLMGISDKWQGSDEPLETQFLLSDQVYAKASIPPTKTVCLWLGANVMLEYSVDDAEALLEKNLTAATSSLQKVESDLDFIRDQYTTTEVNMARVYNYDVKRRQAATSSSSSS